MQKKIQRKKISIDYILRYSGSMAYHRYLLYFPTPFAGVGTITLAESIDALFRFLERTY